MTALDDKLLGEKLQYYYSSSEGEDEDSEKEDKEGESSIPEGVGEVELCSDGSAVNTGIPVSNTLFCKDFVGKFMCFSTMRFSSWKSWFYASLGQRWIVSYCSLRSG